MAIKDKRDCSYEIKLYKAGVSERIYDVKRLKGGWIPDYELIQLCDGGTIHKGGAVTGSELGSDYRTVTVKLR